MDAPATEGWHAGLTQWWFDFLDAKGGKGVSKDTWSMVRPPRTLHVPPPDESSSASSCA
jgi:hypothetical protein